MEIDEVHGFEHIWGAVGFVLEAIPQVAHRDRYMNICEVNLCIANPPRQFLICRNLIVQRLRTELHRAYDIRRLGIVQQSGEQLIPSGLPLIVSVETELKYGL